MPPELQRVAMLLLGVLLASACDGTSPGASGDGTPHQHAASRAGFAGRAFPVPLEKPDFALTDTSGERFDFRVGTEGRVAILFFGYTSCPDICPVHLSNVAGALRRDPSLRDRIRLVFVGVDPVRDTPEHMREWLDHFDPSFVGLTGTPEEMARAQRAAGVPPAVADEPENGRYGVSHPAWMTVYTADGWGRLRYKIETGPERWARDLAWLVERGWPDS